MKILVVGGGGREHALVWKLAQSPRRPEILCAPGNPGTAEWGRNVPVGAEDVEGLLALAERERVDLTVVGPEAPLLAGLADRFREAGLRIFGPSRAAAEIEGSKGYAKALMTRVGIPTARYAAFDSYEEALRYLRSHGAPVVVKADGLAAGKGVVVARTVEEAEAALRSMMVDGVFGESGRRVVLEEMLEGREATVMAFVSGETVVPMVPAQDHKPVFDGNRGPNTGGMGTYSPVPWIDEDTMTRVESKILRPVARALVEDGRPFYGVLYAGLMLTAEGPKVIEFNARFGDPEAQVVLPRLETDLLDVLEAVLDGTLDRIEVRWSPQAAVCVILTAAGYPGSYRKGDSITGLDEDGSLQRGDQNEALIFHAGTARADDGSLVTAGGRVLGVTGLGDSLAQAREAAYRAVGCLRFSGMHYRRDIAAQASEATEAAGQGPSGLGE
ncbi:phosphoribosylamine--glycine ligase [Kyrpidia spormannii]|uniref:Phosphoribosylglycinamide synthetase n=1 Tax=Kyrpidia spormannii TaxID=2055160 RepID=A0ACA8Z532_9BACL|nr:phosphoribosylamine--glycine ligase [Kyrpidia spormannii]CAB3389490.1 phosphoribosylglycinamide synthetase [Kyrpidia spormannii]